MKTSDTVRVRADRHRLQIDPVSNFRRAVENYFRGDAEMGDVNDDCAEAVIRVDASDCESAQVITRSLVA